ncbi:ABC transporter-related protein [Pyrolobus fumarii 1A]|uniref:Probable branched-chain amino acid transport ATP-binding protein LivG n=1 Tax=Pyrolobus fumarii (strain DSM 11204 / 1A) TaxID=694429 RepID=G0ED36_PYRF1|nr:ABC transporter ATP-binding protein [Pyrolobus fumarii]AEM38595.1 ABC transporter-related protein [Pyrolobus fumarii 1A]
MRLASILARLGLQQQVGGGAAPCDTSKYILCVENVKKYFGGVRAVDGVTLRVERGSIVGLIGPNGSGKTTLFNVIAGYYKPDAGQVWFDGRRIDGLSPHEIYKLGLVRTFQTPRLWRSLTVFENVAGGVKGHPGEMLRNAILWSRWVPFELKTGEKALDTIAFVGLSPVAGNMADAISGGQMKLAELGRALMGEPKMLLLDEPAAGVNPTLARQIFEGIVRLREEKGITFLIIEHRLEILFDYVDYVYVMHQGRIIAEGKPAEVAENPLVAEIYLGG